MVPIGAPSPVLPPTINPYEDLQSLVIALVIIGALDVVCRLVGWFPEKKSNTRYFSLHVIVNAYVTAVHFKVNRITKGYVCELLC